MKGEPLMLEEIVAEREKIDRTDRKLAELFGERMMTVKRIAELKSASGKPVFDPGREKAMLEKELEYVDPEMRKYYRRVLSCLLECSKAYQSEIVSSENTLTVSVNGGSYNITVKRGGVEAVGDIFKLDRRVLVVTDSGVPGEYAEAVAARCAEPTVITLPEGEKTKSLESFATLEKAMLDGGFDRNDCVAAVGGGVVGDLTGFAAATYLRGIDYVQIPTSLLAQVDSSVGGKTAIDISAGKNLVGAFKQPKLVIADTDTLKTLSDDFFTDGMGEVVKYGMIYSKSLFDTLKSGNIRSDPEAVIAQCIDIKREVVEADEFDTGLRMILNFGHTLGHAIEKYYNYTGISHGKAVAIGMYLITKTAENNGLIEKNISGELKECLTANGLPFETEIDGASLFAGAVNDKKRFSDTINIILCKEIGKAEIVKLNITDLRNMLEK